MDAQQVPNTGQLFFDVDVEGLYEDPVPVTRSVPAASSVTGTARTKRSNPPAITDPAERDPAAAALAGQGFRGAVACSAAGITYRQLDYWARTGLVEPSIRQASGSGSLRLYSFRDILALQVVKRLLDSGVSLANIRVAMSTLNGLQDCEFGADLSELTLVSDGSGVYLCTSATEVIDLLRGGQAVFGIAVGRVWDEVQASLATFPLERLDEQPTTPARPRLRIVS